MSKRKSVFEIMQENVGKSVFCHAKAGGEGFALKEKCQCYCDGQTSCQAKEDKDFFHAQFEKMDGLTDDMPCDERMIHMLRGRAELIENLPEDLKERQWFKDNVK